ncbi:YrbL family protein [Psychrobacter sp. JCM 18900]|uniref:YrbL family protein n=2 Tax=Psychrobacter sp. JCM 18900 TaxID=1298608 RepID=UPI00043150F9|nr:YrbL family protein [Psychrobacter sp. JCM 18900]GAF52288.1 LOW QUALITY PROTEIN: hypothetical protein JCM18900_1798 [Psychrobacter sp. JCM 18900]
MLLTKNLKLLGQGTQKIVFEHPVYSDKIIKIMNPKHATADGARAKQHYLRAHRSQGIYKQFRRELLQYLQLCKNSYAKLNYTFPIETVYGMIGTDQGLALVTEKITSPNGSVVSVYDLDEDNSFNKSHADALDKFFNECCNLHVVFGEVNIAGIMYTEQRHGIPEFVLVDGIGDKLLIPFRSMSKTINSRNVRKVEAKIKSKIKYYNIGQ